MPTLAQQPTGGVLWLFRESFDIFTIILVLGSFFAVTLIAGVVASLFTALFVSRTFFMLWLQQTRGAKPLSI